MSIRKNKIKQIEESRKKLLESLLEECEMIGGCLSKSYIKCGTPGCHCAKDELHPAMRLSYYNEGKLKNKVVKIADKEKVSKLVSAYRRNKKYLRLLNDLNKKEIDIIKEQIVENMVKYE